MADALSTIVNVSITKEAAALTRLGFGRVNIYGAVPVGFSDDWRDYSSLVELVDDGFATSDLVYKAAQALLAQNPRVKDFRVSKRTTPVAQVITYTPTVQNSTAYSVTINGKVYSGFTSDSDATDAEIVTGLKALVNADADSPVTATGTTTLILTADNAGAHFTYAASANMGAAVVTTASTGPVEDILDMAGQPDGDNWYLLITAIRNDEVSWSIAQTIETLKKLHLFVTTDADVPGTAYSSSTPTDVPSRLKAASITRTAAIYHDDAAEYPDAAWAGVVLPKTPGSTSWKFQTLALVTPIAPSTSGRNNIKAKSANWYEEAATSSIIMAEGTVASGEFLDIMHGTDALERRLAEDVYSMLVKSAKSPGKVPYTTAGINKVATAMRPALEFYEEAGLLAAVPKYSITVPDIADVPGSDKTTRTLNNVKFSATYAGAVHFVNIEGQLSF